MAFTAIGASESKRKTLQDECQIGRERKGAK